MAKRRDLKRRTKKATPVVSESDSDPKQTESVPDLINSEIIAEALSSVNQTVLLKVCRLCESKDGPFLNIFDAEKITAKKIDDIMPFVIAENDDLPHKICFRCSAKVEELYEFIQKCINTQEKLRKAGGKKRPVTMKAKSRTLWEDKLNKCNISNDDICNALIKKAMEGNKDIPAITLEEDEIGTKKYMKFMTKTVNEKDYSLKLKDIATKVDTKSIVKGENASSIKKNSKIDPEVSKYSKETLNNDKKIDLTEKVEKESFAVPKTEIEEKKTNTISIDDDDSNNSSDLESPKPFNIMDHIIIIKVNSVGILFQCKLCNRNFLRKEVVLNHGCAKNGGKKIAEEVKTIAPEKPKIPLIKYINTKTHNDIEKQSENKQNDSKKQVINSTPINLDDDDDDKPLQKIRSKPRIGPASRVKRTENKSPIPQTPSNEKVTAQPVETLAPSSAAAAGHIVQFPTPNSNSRYKLVPGPNNSFMLIEDKAESPAVEPLPNNSTSIVNNIESPVQNVSKPRSVKKTTTNETRNEINMSNQPYPVGLIKSAASQQSSSFPSSHQTFTTPAMKKQSYTIVQTGNPSKLLISTKPQPTEEVPKKKKKYAPQENSQKPYSVTIEEASQPKDAFFTIVNVDPLLQASYVLPTQNIIQESQISTSTAKAAEAKEREKYTCNMCDEKFSREKKLLSHIQSHYNKLDEEDKLRAQNSSKKRKSKS